MDIASSRNLPRLSMQEALFATVSVGPDKSPFFVHKDLLTYHSTFFAAALNGGFKEAGDRAVTLPESDPWTFETFVHWLYHQALPAANNAPPEFMEQWKQDDDQGATEEWNLIRLHCFSDRYGIPKLKLLTLNAFFINLVKPETLLPAPSYVEYAYNNLPEGCGLLRFLVDSFCHYSGDDVWDLRYVNAYPLPFVSEVLKLYSRFVQGERPPRNRLVLCDYHDHKDDAEKESCPSKKIRSTNRH